MNDNKMTPLELRATWGLGSVFFSAHVRHVHGAACSDNLWLRIT